MKPVKPVFSRYFAYIRGLPLGCRYCMKGVKLVVFITGLCDEKCFYCPVSREKLYRDRVWVDEEKAKNINDVVAEAYRIGAEGAGITGGDPLRTPRRTIAVIRLLKQIWGQDFHVHLYTSGRYALPNTLWALEASGLDEIRFHPTTPQLLERILLAKRVMKRTRVGVEIPVIPGREAELKELILWLDKHGIEFINLNELEASASNLDNLLRRGYAVDKERYIVKGSEEAALELVDWASRTTRKIIVHYCPARYKDRIQLRLRLLRKALRIHGCSEKVLPSGLLRTKITPKTNISKTEGENIACYILVNNDYAAIDPEIPVKGCIVDIYPTTNRESILRGIAQSSCRTQ